MTIMATTGSLGSFLVYTVFLLRLVCIKILVMLCYGLLCFALLCFRLLCFALACFGLFWFVVRILKFTARVCVLDPDPLLHPLYSSVSSLNCHSSEVDSDAGSA